MGGNLSSTVKLLAWFKSVCNGAQKLYTEHDFNIYTFLCVCVVSSSVPPRLWWGSQTRCHKVQHKLQIPEATLSIKLQYFTHGSSDSTTVQQVCFRVSLCLTYTDFKQPRFTSRLLNLSLSAIIMTESLYILLYTLSIINIHPWGNVRTTPQYKGYSDINKIN